MLQMYYGFLGNWPLLVLHVLGYLLVDLMLPDRAKKIARFGSVYIGGSVWYSILYFCISLELQAAAAPVAMLLIGLCVVVALVAWCSVSTQQRTRVREFGKHILIWFGSVALLSVLIHQMGFASDSFKYVTQGLNWIEMGTWNPGGAAWARTWGSWGSALHALGFYTQNQYLSLLHPLLAAQLLLMLAGAVRETVQDSRHRLGFIIAVAGLVCLVLAGASFFRAAIVLVHSNLSASGLLLVAVYTATNNLFLQADEIRWPNILFEAFCWASVATVRIEMLPLAAAGLALSILLSNGAYGLRAKMSIAGFTLPLSAWVVGLLMLDTSGRVLLRDGKLYAYFVISSLPFLLAIIIGRWHRAATVLNRLAPWCLVVLLAALFALKPSQMSISLSALVENMVDLALWGWVWPLLLLVWLYAPQQKKTDHVQRFLNLYAGVVLVYVIAAVFFRKLPYRVGMFDSGSRMLLHLLPIGIWVLSRKWFGSNIELRMPLRKLAWAGGLVVVILILDLFALKTHTNNNITAVTEIAEIPDKESSRTVWDGETPIQMPSSDSMIELHWKQPVAVGAVHLRATKRKPKIREFFLEDKHGAVDFDLRTFRSRSAQGQERHDVLFIRSPRDMTSLRLTVSSESTTTAFRDIQIYSIDSVDTP